MKNIWILNHYARPYSGRHYKFAENLTKKGYSVKVFCASTSHSINENSFRDSSKYIQKEFNGVSFVFIKACNYIGNGKKRVKNMFDYATRVIRVSKRLDSDKPDVIYASSVHPLTWISGYRLSKRYKAKFIVETRDLWPETLIAMGRINRKSVPAKLLYKLESFIYKKADKLIFTIPKGQDYLSDRGLETNKSRYINNGIDIEEFNSHSRQYEYTDELLDNQEKFKILYTGSMGVANSLNYLIEAAKLIDEKGYKNIEFILFGDGYQKKELEEYTVKHNINNVTFKGLVEKKYIPNILSKSNLNVFTGQNIYLYKYGLSLNKMFDYFASGKPTVSNIVSGYNKLKKYKCGITVNGGSAESLATGILTFYDMPKKEYEMYCSNALKAAEDFDFKILTNKLERVFLEGNQE